MVSEFTPLFFRFITC